jgi:phage host-nuclease inhibitor protein Gam
LPADLKEPVDGEKPETDQAPEGTTKVEETVEASEEKPEETPAEEKKTDSAPEGGKSEDTASEEVAKSVEDLSLVDKALLENAAMKKSAELEDRKSFKAMLKSLVREIMKEDLRGAIDGLRKSVTDELCTIIKGTTEMDDKIKSLESEFIAKLSELSESIGDLSSVSTKRKSVDHSPSTSKAEGKETDDPWAGCLPF